MKHRVRKKRMVAKISSPDYEVAFAKRVSEQIGIAVPPPVLSHLAKCGRAVSAYNQRRSPEEDADRWLRVHFGWCADKQDLPGIRTANTLKASGHVNPVWLIFGHRNDPVIRDAAHHLKSWGAAVEHAESSVDAARLAAGGEIDGGLINCSGCIVGAHFIAALLMFRGLPYVALTDGREALGFDLGGVVVDRPVSIDEIRAGFESLPERKIWGLSFAASPHPEAAP